MNDQLKFNGQCDTCARPLMGAVGYGCDDLGRRHCYVCCADHDQAYMRKTGKITLYLTTFDNGSLGRITNWPGSLEFRTAYVRRGRHNIAGRRYDAWFWFEGAHWHGVQYGDNTQIMHCRRTKAK